jgi:hypothetical protein
MKKIYLGVMLVLTFGGFLNEFINEFTNSKTIYALFNVDSFIQKDTLINIESSISRVGRQARPNSWVYSGNLLNSKHIGITMDISEETYNNSTPDTLMVWYSEFANLVVKRDTERMNKNPLFQYRFIRPTFGPWLMFFLFIPNLFWYLALSIPHRKKLFYSIIVGYFLLFIFGCVTDFKFIKNQMAYFQNQQK